MKRTIPLLLLSILASGCVVAPYDATTDIGLTNLQRSIDSRVAAMPTTQPADTFYRNIGNDLHLLETRTAARESMDPSVGKELAAMQEIDPMVADLQKLESIHLNDPSEAVNAMRLAQQDIDLAIQTVLAIELRRPR